MTDVDTALRCSAWAREVELSPIGTVGSYRGFLLVETPLPWPRDVAEIAVLQAAAERAAATGYRLQALVPADLGAPPQERRVIAHTTSGGAFSGYTRRQTQVGESLAAALDALLDPADPPEATTQVDLLVCTHGRRDVCCGSQGTDLALRLAAAGTSPGVALWRTSHTGGHRFAPTVLALPQGTGWAFMDPATVEQVLTRAVPFSEVADHYRGCAGLEGPQAQALEREVLIEVGWELLDRPRRGFLTGETTADGGLVARLEAGVDQWEAVVRPGRTLPVPDCMKPLSESVKSETEWLVGGLRSLSGTASS
ncbi:MAG: sucrase ferredoxin [Acidobacteriota bacterium]|nr:sucrase ferredoxin [Acidobacteriota bacterium]